MNAVGTVVIPKQIVAHVFNQRSIWDCKGFSENDAVAGCELGQAALLLARNSLKACPLCWAHGTAGHGNSQTAGATRRQIVKALELISDLRVGNHPRI